MEIAYNISQTTRSKVFRHAGREYIENITFTPESVTGESFILKLNPTLLNNTRLQRFADNYQKFRFRRLALTLQSSVPTTVGGLYMVGYNNNPDDELDNSAGAIAQVFDLYGSSSANVWRPTTSHAQILDKNKWYYTDPDSSEIMNTTQGYFAVVLQAPIGATDAITFPVILDYEVEFMGNALHNRVTSPTVKIFPRGTFTDPTISGNLTFVIDAAETTAGLVVPVVAPDGSPWALGAAWTITDHEGLEQQATIVSFSSSWHLYTSLENFQNELPIYATLVGQSAPRNTVAAIVPN